MDRYRFLNIGRSKRYAEYGAQDPERYHGESFTVHILLQVLGNRILAYCSTLFGFFYFVENRSSTLLQGFAFHEPGTEQLEELSWELCAAATPQIHASNVAFAGT